MPVRIPLRVQLIMHVSEQSVEQVGIMKLVYAWRRQLLQMNISIEGMQPRPFLEISFEHGRFENCQRPFEALAVRIIER